MNLFRRKAVDHVDHNPQTHGHSEADLRAAYERGRKEERARHKRSPFLAMGLVAVALIGGTSLVLAAKEGSFRDGGALMDAGVSTAAREAVPTLKKGAEAVQDSLSTDEPASSNQPAG
ncbi:MAG: hypothetical protein EON95_02200 [Caulobacteraceae bacterium]|nr:hypothetical protein [Caulobacter sp.]RYF95257.1 MAG: hypothetical protein EON95_02200 [Caulobacteraceae bacterium]